MPIGLRFLLSCNVPTVLCTSADYEAYKHCLSVEVSTVACLTMPILLLSEYQLSQFLHVYMSDSVGTFLGGFFF